MEPRRQSHARDLGKTAAAFVGPMPRGEFGLDLVDLRLQLPVFLGLADEQLKSTCACSPGGVSNRTSKRRSRSGRLSCTARLTAV
jgi:hypothetical protein